MVNAAAWSGFPLILAEAYVGLIELSRWASHLLRNDRCARGAPVAAPACMPLVTRLREGEGDSPNKIINFFGG